MTDTTTRIPTRFDHLEPNTPIVIRTTGHDDHEIALWLGMMWDGDDRVGFLATAAREGTYGAPVADVWHIRREWVQGAVRWVTGEPAEPIQLVQVLTSSLVVPDAA